MRKEPGDSEAPYLSSKGINPLEQGSPGSIAANPALRKWTTEAKMIPILEELAALMERFELSPAEVARLIGCSEGTAYNWLRYQTSSPGPVFQQRVRAAIRKIKKDHGLNSLTDQINEFFKLNYLVWPALTPKERDGLMKIINQSNKDFKPAYLKRLKALAAAHKIKVKGESDE